MNVYNPPYLNLRPACSNDLAEMERIDASCYAEPWSLQRFSAELDNPVAHIILAEDDAAIVGYVCWWEIAGEIEIHNVATAAWRRRSGVARRLLEWLCHHADKNNIKRMFLEVRRSNKAAIALYHRFGFAADGCRRAYYANGEDALLMSRDGQLSA